VEEAFLVEYPRCSEDSLYSVYNNNNNLQYVIYHNEYNFLTKKGSTKNMLFWWFALRRGA
jgi:hypothetical protein